MNPVGPMFVFELARVARRQRLTTGRCLYVFLLLGLLALIYLSLFSNRGPDSLMDFLFRSSVNPRDLATFGLTFFMVFTFVQYFIGSFSMASSAAAILAEEKERHTLPFLLTTTLADHEIVLGKLAARVAQVMMLLMAGLPVLATMQVMGGIDPVLLAYSFIAIFATIISAAGLGAWASVMAHSVKAATGWAVMTVACYTLIVPYVGFGLQAWCGASPLLPTPWGVVTVGEVVDWVNSGNLIWVTAKVGRIVSASGHLVDLLAPVLLQFVIFHAIVALATGGWAAMRLRKILAKQSERANRTPTKPGTRGRIPIYRRPVSQTRPVLWRETATLVTKPGQKRWHRIFRVLCYCGSFIPLVVAIYEGATRMSGRPNAMASNVHELVLGLGTMVLSGVILSVAVNASGMLGRERRKKTLEELFLTELSNKEILTQKTLAAAWSVRWGLIWVGIHWIIDLLVGGLHPLVLLIVPTLTSVYLLFAARFGMMCSAYESPKVRPGPAAALGMMMFAGLPWLLPLIHSIVVDYHDRNNVEYTAWFAAGLSPPGAIATLTVGFDDLNHVGNTQHDKSVAVCFIAGLAISMLLCWALSSLAWRKAKRRLAEARRE
jgi:ABC-type Na+ efflux pump permease subunit